MGIFNFTIAAPQIVSGLVSGWILSNIFDNDASHGYIIDIVVVHLSWRTL